MCLNIWLAVHAKNPQYESNATLTSILIKSVFCVEISSDLASDTVTASEPLLSEWNTAFVLCLKWHCAVWPQGLCRSGPLMTSLSSAEGGVGASAPARWPPGTSRALCLTERQAFVNPAGDGLWFIHSFSRISLLCSLVLVWHRWGPWNLGCVLSDHVTGDWFWTENSMEFVC